MADVVNIGGLKVAGILYRLVRDEIAPGTGVDADAFWHSLDRIVQVLAPKNRQLLEQRKSLEKQIAAWCVARRGQPLKMDEYKSFLAQIGYQIAEGADFHVSTANVDREIAVVSGPQLVVPLDNARYALNAANARWGSLYDALYGTNVIPEDSGAEKGKAYNPVRGSKVIAQTEAFLDEAVGLARGKFSDVRQFSLEDKDGTKQLVATLSDGGVVGLAAPGKFVGFTEQGSELTAFVLKNNELHIEVQIDRNHPIGKAHAAGVKDVLLEAAITTIEDCEDSVAAVDATDKARIYGNWNGIMKGMLEATFERNGRQITRRLNPDRSFTAPRWEACYAPGQESVAGAQRRDSYVHRRCDHGRW